MMIEGERLKELLGRARVRVLLCAPFVKARVLQTLLTVVRPEVPVRIVTRWRAEEIAAGVSDLEVFEVARDRAGTTLWILDDVHAKLYVADDNCLVGSANLTAAALGWGRRHNLELLVPSRSADAEVVELLKSLEMADEATAVARDAAGEAAAAVRASKWVEGQEMLDDVAVRSPRWLPRCAAPERLYEIYRNPDTQVVAEGTRADALADLRDLGLPGGLSESAFIDAVGRTLRRVPTVARVVHEVPQGLADARGVALVSELRRDLAEGDAREQWRIMREWIGVFFGKEFEVAPDSFVTRLRAK